MATHDRQPGALYHWGGWMVAGVAGNGNDIAGERLTETHEYFHCQLDDTTASGG